MNRISIIVPIYNSAPYLTALIDSLVSQTYANKEILLIDDGSEDESGKICDEYADKYEFVKTFHIANSGVQNARNVGLMRVSGDYIAFVDSDDVLDLDCYEILINALEKNNCDIAACRFQNEFGRNMHMISKHRFVPEGIVVKGREGCLKTIGGRPVDSARYVWNKVFKRELVENVRFRPEIVICDDLFFIYEAFSNATSIIVVDLPMYHYRYHSSGIVHGASVIACEQCVEGLEELIIWMKEKAEQEKAKSIFREMIKLPLRYAEEVLNNHNIELILFVGLCIYRISKLMPRS